MQALRNGKDVVFVDTGWRALMIQELIAILREEFKDEPEELKKVTGKGGLIKSHFAYATTGASSAVLG